MILSLYANSVVVNDGTAIGSTSATANSRLPISGGVPNNVAGTSSASASMPSHADPLVDSDRTVVLTSEFLSLPLQPSL